MLNSIRTAQEEGRILPDIKVDYETVERVDFIWLVHQTYPELKGLIKGDTMSYLLSGGEDSQSREVSITRNATFEVDYFIVRSSTHDGTLAFTLDLYQEIMSIILSGASHSKDSPYRHSEDCWNYDVSYKVGDVFHFTDMGMKDINGNKMRGQTDILVMPVKIDYAQNTGSANQ